MVKNPPANAGHARDVAWPLGQEDPLEEGMAAHSSILAWETSWTEEPGRLQSMGSQESAMIEHACMQGQISLGVSFSQREAEEWMKVSASSSPGIYHQLSLISIPFFVIRSSLHTLCYSFLLPQAEGGDPLLCSWRILYLYLTSHITSGRWVHLQTVLNSEIQENAAQALPVPRYLHPEQCLWWSTPLSNASWVDG